ncbi:MAG: hypothetical protein COT88_01740 [Candidatus Colwellbacteria bacterium CG10_big_fil_rev_8_21_14_0_10_41_28]|uniref:Uncharacterized protein n=1 Tax=Candidatus Colwellbacteria bacterium CG10_big_fil_rev_8_21_14_0_10_41_28 TaxID=1974539 RepID=A0A2H0VH18_9BACT|nr:MAG: hypothetical protein COT88_01740 [Candidatus Colwellbacteria bacterium CG10_big_fil_rev_8_21_14_0_10_41_28]
MSLKQDLKELYASKKKEIIWVLVLGTSVLLLSLGATLTPIFGGHGEKELKEAREESTVLTDQIIDALKLSEESIDSLDPSLSGEELQNFINGERERTLAIGEKGVEFSQKVNLLELGFQTAITVPTLQVTEVFMKLNAKFFSELTDYVDESKDLIVLLERRSNNFRVEDLEVVAQIEKTQRDIDSLYKVKEEYDSILPQFVSATGY